MESKTALVTGASRGIGKSIKEVLTTDGIKIVSPSRNELDLSSSESIDKFLSQMSEDIDIIINNAGILKVGKHNELSSDDFHEILQVNVVAPFRIISGFVEKMKIRNFGRIVNISSVWGQKSKEGRTLYSSSKAALDALTRSLAIEFASYNILINSVAPGYIETDMLKQCNTEDELNIIRDTIPMKRFGKKIEIAELVRFLRIIPTLQGKFLQLMVVIPLNKQNLNSNNF